MAAQSEVSKALDEAFRAAFLLTGSTEAAENAVLDGIAALEFGYIVDDVLLVETVKSAIQRRADLTSQSAQAPCTSPSGASTAISACPGFSRLFCIASSPWNTSCDLLRGSASHDKRDRRRAVRRPARAAAPRSLQLNSARNYPSRSDTRLVDYLPHYYG